ncbi:MAG: permease prefix domain 1-containing protein [Vicinamibacterales bacterium]
MLFRRGRFDADLHAELAGHIAEREAHYIRDGMPPAEAYTHGVTDITNPNLPAAMGGARGPFLQAVVASGPLGANAGLFAVSTMRTFATRSGGFFATTQPAARIFDRIDASTRAHYVLGYVGETWQKVSLTLGDASYRRAVDGGVAVTVRVPVKGAPRDVKAIVYDDATDLVGSATVKLR